MGGKSITIVIDKAKKPMKKGDEYMSEYEGKEEMMDYMSDYEEKDFAIYEKDIPEIKDKKEGDMCEVMIYGKVVEKEDGKKCLEVEKYELVDKKEEKKEEVKEEVEEEVEEGNADSMDKMSNMKY